MGFKLPNLSFCTIDITQHALKGQKLLAQGNALGIMSVSNAPCKGNSFKIHIIKKVNPLRYVKLFPIVLKLLPLQGALFATHKNPGRCPGLRASALSGRAAYMSFLPSGRVAYIGFLAFRACCLYWLLAFRACCFSAVYVMWFFDNLCFLLFFHRKDYEF